MLGGMQRVKNHSRIVFCISEECEIIPRKLIEFTKLYSLCERVNLD